MESFSKKLKDQLREEEIKKKCCRFTANAVSGWDSEAGCGEELRDIFGKCRCESCRSILVRQMFLERGSVTDPGKNYHLDFTFPAEETALAMQEILMACGFSFGASVRRGKYVIYMKNSTDIEDFLVFIGAQTAAFDVMNSKIVREFRNSVNRQVNCDTANIEKQLKAAGKYISAIESLTESGKLDTLSAELKEAARLRMEHKQMPLAELSALTNPPVSKSGMKHRLEKLLAIANDET